jgi:hypothetical protein
MMQPLREATDDRSMAMISRRFMITPKIPT